LEEEFSAAEFVRRSTVVIKELIKKGKIPVFAGGTGLYVKALIDGLFPSPAKDNDLRHQLESEASALGTGYLYNILKEKDPDSASLIHANDLRRIIRALEVYYLTGVPISEHKKNTRGIKDDYEIVYAGLSMGRELLYKTIDERVDKMFEDGLVEEVKKVIGSKLSMTAGLALGIREVRGFLEGEYPENTARELLKQNTRRYAKRQLTWFGADKRIRWFDEGKSVIDHCRACL
jgi:tRNA dimethylallyltransferase